MNCPVEFETKTTVNPWWLISVGGLIWGMSLLVILQIIKILNPLLPAKEWIELYRFTGQFILTLCLIYFAREIGINIHGVVQDWWKNKIKHLRIISKYFVIYAGSLVFALGVLAAIFILLEETGTISHSILADLAVEMDPKDKMVRLKFLLDNSTPLFIVSLINMCVLAPVIEETFFRRFLFVALRKKMNFTPALLISSVSFMAVHPNMALGAIGGIYLGYVYEKGKSLPANILIHSTANLAVIATSILLGA